MLVKDENGKFKFVPGREGAPARTSWDGRISIEGDIRGVELLTGHNSLAILISTERGPDNTIYSINIDKIHEGRETDPPLSTRPLETKDGKNGER